MSESFDFASEVENLTDEQLGKTIPDCECVLRVKSAEAGTTGKGKPKFTVRFVITDGPHRGKELTDNLYYSPGSDTAVSIFWANMKSMGVTTDWVKQNRPTPNQIANKLIGALTNAELTTEEFGGVDRNRVRFRGYAGRAQAAAASSRTASPMDEDADESEETPVDVSHLQEAPAEKPAARSLAEAAGEDEEEAKPTIDLDKEAEKVEEEEGAWPSV